MSIEIGNGVGNSGNGGGGGSIPSQEGQEGKVLSTNGEQLEWVEGYKPNLFDIKTISEPTAQKGWSCISYPTQNKLAKADVPTAYDFLKDKLDNADATIGGWQTGSNNLESYIVDDNVLIFDKYNCVLYHAKIEDINDNTKWILISDPLSAAFQLRGIWIVRDIIYIFCDQLGNEKYLWVINKNTFEVIKKLTLRTQSTGGLTWFAYYNGYVYLVDSAQGIGDISTRLKYSLNADENVLEELAITSYKKKVFRYSNGYYYYYGWDTGIYKATDLADGGTETLLCTISGSYCSDYNGNLITVSATGTIKVTTNIESWTDNAGTQTWQEKVLDFTDYGSVDSTATSLTTFYHSQNGYVFVFACSDKQIALYSTNLINFQFVVELDSNYDGNNQIDTNGTYANYNKTYAYTLMYSSTTPASTVYTDTINGIDIKYYKNGDWKICTPDIAVGNDDNLQSVFEFLGYLNYWWIDTTEEKITLQRNSNMWTMMYVGDDYIDTSLPNGNNQKLKAEQEYIENSSASITIDVKGNQFYKFTNNAITDITIDSCEDSIEETTIKFTTGNSTPTLNDNANLVWYGGIPTLLANTSYTIVIVDKTAYYQEN